MDREEFDVTLGDYLYARRRRQQALVSGSLLWGGLFLLALACICAIARADERDVPSSARREIAMRGEMIEYVDGQVRADIGADLIGQAAETPPDDSHQWHLTILTTGNNQACQRLKSDLLTSPAFRDWLAVEERQGLLRSTAESHFHVCELRYDGDVGRDWGRKLEQFMKRKIDQFPTLVIQPPINGSCGKHTDVVFLQHGYDGRPERLVADMAKEIGRYCQKVQHVRTLARAGGHRQDAGEDGEVGAQPIPFQLAPTNPPPTPGLWNPATIIPPRVAATVEQIRQHCPECDAEFLLSQISKQATIEEATAAWQQVSLVKQIAELKRLQEEAAKKKAEEEAAKKKAETPAPQPALPTPPPAVPTGFSLTTLVTAILATFLGGGGLGSMLVWGLTAIRKRRQAAGQPTIPQAVFDQIVQAVLAALASQPPKVS